MMIIMKTSASQEELENVLASVKGLKLHPHRISGSERNVIGVVGDGRPIEPSNFIRLPGVASVIPISKPYKLASREFYPENTLIPIGDHVVGNGTPTIIGGPCAVESRDQILEVAKAVKEAGAHALRGGAFKPRTSPYSFQGMGEDGLKLLAEARDLTGLPIVTEVTSPDLVPLVADYAEVLQIGARNMQNYALLKAAGQTNRTVLLKRGMSATINDLLMAAEYILAQGNQNVILCERGIRTFETATRNTTDINAIPVLQAQTHLPVILDPSHSTGHWEYVSALARSGIAAGADGIIVEVHPDPACALSDGAQSLKPRRFKRLVKQVNAIANALKAEDISTNPLQ
ncbi:MAG: 3-deoxy-7-phosphoheptulonate synthase [Anaerolineae bacterium]|nr:3-deoxy-7-phosphoheptulonate synthase [Anaerolineae bacterium]MBT7072134.1 3-deoxy-7-phosphoheptulonate synthase [Anaerolineae bacterium]MBT7326783.1 3-deoxy-7-phosphoheptulonate synthase [Anaerolineae bacterium]